MSSGGGRTLANLLRLINARVSTDHGRTTRIPSAASSFVPQANIFPTQPIPATLQLLRRDEHFGTASLSPPSAADQEPSSEEPVLDQQLVGDPTKAAG